jgi:predicted transcriptional regulator
VDLPLELALALLTDANGVIDLAVPVSGNVDDPEFGLGSVIGTAFVNLITKAVTAPFSLLANLVGAEEDLQRLNFTSGSSELRDATKVKLDQLAQAMQQRPGLALIVMGRLNRDADHEYLQIAALREEFIASGLSTTQIENKEPAFVDELERRYRRLGISGDIPTPPQQYNAVRETMPVSDSALQELIEARAVAIKSYLVNEQGMPADKIAIEQTGLDDEAHQFSGAELALES